MRGISNLAPLLLLGGVWMLLGTVVSPAKIHGNPANDLVALINGKRSTSNSKLPPLRNSAGLGCMALQYISECIGDKECSSNNTVECQPPEAHITEVYAANCGVELPTVDVISGQLIGCSRGTEEAVLGDKALAVIRGKEHTQVGAAFDRRGPFFFWGLLFSSGSANSTFRLEAAGRGIPQTHGCSSGPDRLSCNAATPPRRGPGRLIAAALLLLLHFQMTVILA